MTPAAFAEPNPQADPGTFDCARVSIERLGAERLAELQNTPGLERWAEMDDMLFACGPAEIFDGLRKRFAVGSYWPNLPKDRLFVTRAAHPGHALPSSSLEMLVRGGPFSIATTSDPAEAAVLRTGHWPGLEDEKDGHGDHAACKLAYVRSFDTSLRLARQAANQQKGGTVFGEAAAEAAAAVDGQRWFADVETLAGWNRWTRGTEIHQARDWLVGQMTGIGLATTTEDFQVGATTAYNVIGVWTGTARPDDWFLIGAHYDSTSQNTSQAAPGAEDNASGCAGVLELARVLIPMQPEATMVFICYSGEEQGLYGSDDHASKMVASGDSAKLQRIHIMDMIGYTGDSDLDLLLETRSEHEGEFAALIDAAEAFTDLRMVTSLFPFGSDHMPYLNRGLGAVLAIENDYGSYPQYHRTNDLPENITIAMGEKTLVASAAVLAQEAGAKSSSALFSNSFEDGGTGGWSEVVQ